MIDDLAAFVRARLTESKSDSELYPLWEIVNACVAEIEAEDQHDYISEGGDNEAAVLARFVLMMLARPYADHPDYRTVWH